MRARLNLSWLIAGFLLLAPAAHGAETNTEPVAAEAGEGTDVPRQQVPEEDGVQPQQQASGENGAVLQQQVVDESEDETNEPKATKADVEAVHNEVEVLRDQWQRSLDRSYPTTVVQSNRPLIISGTGQLRYTHPRLLLNDSPTASTAYNNFSIPFFNINFAGNLRKDYEEGKNIDYQLGIQTTGSSTISITDAWLSYQILNSLDKEKPRLSITGGQQKKYFGNEATATEAFKPTITGAQFATKLNLDQRDIGFVLAGDLFPYNDYGYNYRVPLFQYWLGVINGKGPNTSDINNSKDFFGRIQINAPVHYDHLLRGLSLGLSGYKGWDKASATTTTTRTTTVNTPTGTTTISTSSSATRDLKGPKERWGADLAYVNTPIGFTLEYVRGRDVIPTNGTVKINNGTTTSSSPSRFKTTDEEGYTFTLFYNFGDQFVSAAKAQDRYSDWYPLTYQPFVRFDRWVPDTDKRGIRTDIWTVGFNWFFAQTTKLQLNYNITRDYQGSKGVTNVDTFLGQFQFGF